jgi:myo-inositol-1(or 4)-monophosphatase
MDRKFEAIILEELHALTVTAPVPTMVISEEVGDLGSAGGAAERWVVIDPIDGSKNFANGLPAFALSVAVADGETMDDVWFAFVFDFGAAEEFVCEWREGRRHLEVDGIVFTASPDRAPATIVAFESAEPPLLVPGLAALAATQVDEIRVVGAIAIALCYLATGRVSGLVTCKQCRSVDAAAGQMIAAAFDATVLYDGQARTSAQLDLSARYRLVAARADLAEALLTAQQTIPLVPR